MSVAVQVTVVVPRAKLLPGAWLVLIPAIPQLSPPEGAA